MNKRMLLELESKINRCLVAIERRLDQLYQELGILEGLLLAAIAYGKNDHLNRFAEVLLANEHALWQSASLSIRSLFDTCKDSLALPALLACFERHPDHQQWMLDADIQTRLSKAESGALTRVGTYASRCIAHNSVKYGDPVFANRQRVSLDEVLYDLRAVSGIVAELNQRGGRAPTLYSTDVTGLAAKEMFELALHAGDTGIPVR
jgi:hypothetical protein